MQSTIPFVNRRYELRSLAASLGDSVAAPAVIAIQGVSGIGKTRLVEEHLDHHRDALVVRSRSYERDRTPLRIVDQFLTGGFGGARRDPDRIDSETRDGPELMGSRLAREIRAASRLRPVIAVVEDLQWIDEASGQVVSQLVDRLTDPTTHSFSRGIQLVLIHRIDPPPAARRILDAAGLKPGDPRYLTLEGFQDLDIREYITASGLGRSTARFSEILKEATGGNALQVQLGLRQLQRGNRLQVQSGRVDLADRTEALIDLRRPLEAVVRTELSFLDGADLDVLRNAAILDQPFTDATLDGVSEGDEARAVLNRSDEWRITARDGLTHTFAHPQFRQALLESMPPGDIARRHDRAAQFLLSKNDTDRIMETAGQLLAGTRQDVDLVATVTDAAARHAIAIGAYAAAAHFADASIDYTRLTGATPTSDAFYRLGLARFRNHEPESYAKPLLEAIDRARQDGNARIEALAVLTLNRGHFTFSRAELDISPTVRLMEQLGSADHDLRARLGEDLAEHAFVSGAFNRGVGLGWSAVEIADQSDDILARSTAHFSIGLNEWARLNTPAALTSFETSLSLAEQADDPWYMAWGAGRLPIVHWMRGELQEARLSAERAENIATDIGDWSERALAVSSEAGVLLTLGDLDAAIVSAERAVRYVRRSEYVWAPALAFSVLSQVHALRGDHQRLEAVADEWRQFGGQSKVVGLYAAYVLGDRDQVSRLFDPKRMSPPATAMNLSACSIRAEVSAILGPTPSSTSAAHALRAVPADDVGFTTDLSISIPRALSLAAIARGDHGGAALYADHAVHLAAESGALLELGLALRVRGRLGYGQADDLDRAEKILSDLGLTNTGQYAVRSRTQIPLASAPPRHRVLLYTDIVGSTALNVEVGDEAWVRAMERHDEVLRASLKRAGGVEFAHTGDGIGAWFSSATAAVACAQDIHRALATTPFDSLGDRQITVRIGISSGTPHVQGTRLGGASLARTVRVMSHANARETATTRDVLIDLPLGQYEFINIGEHELKGLDREQLWVDRSARNLIIA